MVVYEDQLAFESGFNLALLLPMLQVYSLFDYLDKR